MKKSDIEAFTRRILNDQSITEPAIDVERIADSAGVKVTFQGFEDDSSGLLFIHGGKAIIAVNIEHPDNRQRFTIAHELGHFYLHAANKKEELFVDKSLYYRNEKSSTGTIKQEVEANHFAASLLMPEKMIIKIIKDEDLDLSDDLDLYLLAERFGVSEKAMGYRLGYLDICF